MGPITPVSLGGARYVLVVVDSATRYVWVSSLESKRGAVEAIIEMVKQAESQHEAQVKRIISDGGKEFVNRQLKDWCLSRGIETITTTPYTPQHNGMPERNNRTLESVHR